MEDFSNCFFKKQFLLRQQAAAALKLKKPLATTQQMRCLANGFKFRATYFANRRTRKEYLVKYKTNYVICRPGNDLLSRALRQSTIGAKTFHYRVRNGIGCSHLAIITRSANYI